MVTTWMAEYGQVNHSGYKQHQNQLSLSIPLGYVNRVSTCLARAKAGICIYLRQVAGNGR